MSYVTIFKIEQSGDVVPYGEGSNNHVFAPIVWEVLGYKYQYMNKERHPYFLRDPGLEAMWNTWPDAKMSRLEQVLLGATFDRMWCKREMVPELIEACEWFLSEHVRKPHQTTDWKGNQVEAYYDSRALAGDADDSIYKRKGIIRSLKEIYEDPTSRGIAFNCCSAVSDFWYVHDVPLVGESEDGIQHTKDSDCTVEDGSCTICDVWHNKDACAQCGASAFHKENCDQYEWQTRPWNIDKDMVQPRGPYVGKRPSELSEGLAGYAGKAENGA
jgi:hypothetical protein